MNKYISIENYWAKSAETLLNTLGSTSEGLSSNEARSRLIQFGYNTLETKEKVGPVLMFLTKLKDPIILILLFATVVSAVTGEWIDATIILAIIFGSITLSFFQEYKAGNAAAKLREQISLKTTVLRNGQKQSIPAGEVVPGDVIILSAGSLIPADGLILKAENCYINQASLTGETFPVLKEPGVVNPEADLAQRSNCVYMGTNVRSGSVKVLIVQTGTATVFGKVAVRLTSHHPETEFEHGIRNFGAMLTHIMFVMVLLVFAVNVFYHKPVLNSLLFSIALAVGLTPQLLPAIISITLSRGAQLMADNNVIVRKMESIENFGSMDLLCTDKTGTLTVGIVKLDSSFDIHGQPSEDVFRYAYFNAYFETGLVNPLDEAILSAEKPNIEGAVKIAEIPYDFIRKRLTIVVRFGEESVVITKGALDNVIEVCTSVQDGRDTLPLTDNQRTEIQRLYAEWSKQGFRVLGVAVRRDGSLLSSYTRDDEHDMTFIGYLLFFDPPKEGVKETIKDMNRQGVQLKIITGDNKLVTNHVAVAVGMNATGILTGQDIQKLSDEALWIAAEKTTLFAEVDPNQKERIILALKKRGHVVGYMGDGINDAPALHAADVGISVDTAVDVAKDAADFVLLKHDLSVLHQGIVLGRTIFANTLKYIYTTISANFGNMFSMSGASFFLPFLPMLPAQILLTNFLTDLPSMNIARDNVDYELVEKPHRLQIAFIKRFMVTFGLASSVFDFMTFGVLLLIFKANQETFRTGWFFESIMTELLIVFIVRTRRPFYLSKPNKMLLIITMIIAAVTLVLPYSPLNKILGLIPLPVPILLVLVIITLLYLVVTEILKHFFYKRKDTSL